MSSDVITLWTRQVPEVWQELQASGVYRVKKEYIQKKNGSIADYYLSLYRWYTYEAGKHIRIPEGLEYPIWLCGSEETMLQPIEDTVILKLEVPKEKVLLCNMDAWGYVVNYWYVPLDEEDARKHAEELARYGIREEDELISTSKGNFYPLLKQKIQNSWGRIFTMPPAKEEDAVYTIWDIRREWVKEVQNYDRARKQEEDLSENGCMTLWTAQTQTVLDTVLENGASYVKKAYIREKYQETAWIFETAYDFFIRYFAARVPKPEQAESPIWLFYDPVWAGAGPYDKLLKLRVPVSELILFDRENWGQVLNLAYIGDKEEWMAFEETLRKRGIQDGMELFQDMRHPTLREKVTDSWQKIFDISKTERRNLQGAVWCLKKEWIEEIRQ